MIKKIKRNWKRILLIGAVAYVAIAIISTAVGAVFIKGRMDKIEKCEDEIGKAFVERKADFQERFNKNWNAKRGSLIEGFKSTEKHSDKHGLDGLKGAQETVERILTKYQNTPEEIVHLEKKLQKRAEQIASGEAAFKKKWFSQKDNETLEEFERRQDEGSIDWQGEYVARCEWRRKDTTDEYELEDSKQHLKREKEHLSYLQEKFQNKYGEPYDGTEFLEVCVVLQEQARKETQEFLASVAAKQAAKAQKDELFPMMSAKNVVIRAEKEQCRFSEKSYLSLRHLHKQLSLYTEYNSLVADFEGKWGIKAEEPLKELKAESEERALSRSSFVDWGFLPVDYLAKEKELNALLPKLELDFDTQYLESLRERIPIEEAELNKWQKKEKAQLYLVWDDSIKRDKEKERLEKLHLRPSLLSLEEAFEKKWTPKTEEESLEQFERRQAEGNIQFLRALLDRFELDGLNGATHRAAQEVLSQSEESFFVEYGEVCPQANHFNVASN